MSTHTYPRSPSSLLAHVELLPPPDKTHITTPALAQETLAQMAQSISAFSPYQKRRSGYSSGIGRGLPWRATAAEIAGICRHFCRTGTGSCSQHHKGKKAALREPTPPHHTTTQHTLSPAPALASASATRSQSRARMRPCRGLQHPAQSLNGPRPVIRGSRRRD